MGERMLLEATPTILDHWIGPAISKRSGQQVVLIGHVVVDDDLRLYWCFGLDSRKDGTDTADMFLLDFERDEVRDRVDRVLQNHGIYPTIVDRDQVPERLFEMAQRFFHGA